MQAVSNDCSSNICVEFGSPITGQCPVDASLNFFLNSAKVSTLLVSMKTLDSMYKSS